MFGDTDDDSYANGAETDEPDPTSEPDPDPALLGISSSGIFLNLTRE